MDDSRVRLKRLHYVSDSSLWLLAFTWAMIGLLGGLLIALVIFTYASNPIGIACSALGVL